ncbi:hypothetical protein J7E25_11840 [Agromyces sp. ISL-38]|uniref:hypothetical protein n=1 Tax=Agromyces sp. ISL-38 TaxID=2819107 RepID=UPI001BE6AC8C|nr:hypothetical protein [Agromyces sp. ISL-38]MBT2499786.1 hypothetical protein [Agromyces sp. ISL-38]
MMDPLAELAAAPPLDLAAAAPDAFDGWEELAEPGIRRVRVFTRRDVTAVLVAGPKLYDVVAVRGSERRVLVLQLGELDGAFAALAEGVDP